MSTIIIDRENDIVIINGNKYTFRSFIKNNNGIVPTYVLHVNDEDLNNIKATLPQCNTIIIDISKSKHNV